MANISDVILQLIKSAFFGAELPDFGKEPFGPLEDADWEKVFAELKEQAIAPSFSDILKKIPLPENVYEAWRRLCLSEFTYRTALLGEEAEIFRLFEEGGVPAAVLKGSAAAIYYSDPSLRPLGDLDILVEKKDFDKAAEILESAGLFKKQVKNPSYIRHEAFEKYPVTVELHRFFAVTDSENAEDEFINSTLEGALSGAVKEQHPKDTGKAESRLNSWTGWE